MLVESSKNRITEETLAKLQNLAKSKWRAGSSRCSLARESNRTESRAVLHA
ncbi:hypothetical protein ACLK19_27165 [Escherichia coli]